MVVVALIGILAAIAAPSMKKTIPRTKLRSAATQLTNDLQFARLKGISGNYKTQIVFDTAAGTYTRYLDNDRDGTLGEAGEADITARTMPTGISFTSASTAPNVTFDPTGTADDGTGNTGDITVTLQTSTSPPESRQITVNRTMGTIRLD
jgi:Tfp pilus assembly protein FimT